MDLKTLRLATLQLSAERLDAFVRYQRTLLVELERAPAGEWSGRYAFAHGRAASIAGLDPVELGKLKAIVGAFCGRRSAFHHVKARVEEARAGDVGGDARLAKAEAQLPRLASLGELEARHGPEAVALLTAREDELLALHRALAAQEGAGHLHPAS